MVGKKFNMRDAAQNICEEFVSSHTLLQEEQCSNYDYAGTDAPITYIAYFDW